MRISDGSSVGCSSDLLTICGRGAGHVEDLRRCLAELWRVTRPGGSVLCSDVHPIGQALGWVRDFRFDGQRYAVAHTQHLYGHWHDACASVGLPVEQERQTKLYPDDIQHEIGREQV